MAKGSLTGQTVGKNGEKCRNGIKLLRRSCRKSKKEEKRGYLMEKEAKMGKKMVKKSKNMQKSGRKKRHKCGEKRKQVLFTGKR